MSCLFICLVFSTWEFEYDFYSQQKIQKYNISPYKIPVGFITPQLCFLDPASSHQRTMGSTYLDEQVVLIYAIVCAHYL